MEICRNIRSVQSLAAMNALEARADVSERHRRFRAGIFVEKQQVEEEVLCPKPRRPKASSGRRSSTRGSTPRNGEAGFEILEIFLNKGSYTDGSSFGCSPPYFSGSPPARAANPLVRDVQFARQRAPPSPTQQNTSSAASRISATPCVRVEGFAADTCSRVSALA